MEKINIGLVGFGTIGSGVVSLLSENGEAIRERTGIDFNVKYIVDKDLKKLSQLENYKTSDNYKDIIEDSSIDIVLELAGGVEFPHFLFKESMKSKKHFVTANKALLSKNFYDMFKETRENELYIGFEASVAGGIPVIKTIRNSLIGNKIKFLQGIINGTTNYILTQMEENNLDFQAALTNAQKLGLAEADPTLDVNGDDAASKIAILASLAFNQNIERNDVYMEGIEKLELIDVKYAKELDYKVKLIAISRINDKNEVEIRVHPTLVKNSNPLADVKNEFNAVLIDSDYLGMSMYYGKGAGSRPTASSVISDIVEIGNKIVNKKAYNKNTFLLSNNKKIKEMSKVKSKYYVRIMTEDKPGILAKVASVLGENSVSVASMIQTEGTGTYVPMVFTTHEAFEGNFIKSYNEIQKFDFVEKVVFYRILD